MLKFGRIISNYLLGLKYNICLKNFVKHFTATNHLLQLRLHLRMVHLLSRRLKRSKNLIFMKKLQVFR